MSSKQGQSCINPLLQSNMEGAMGTVAPAGLPKADSLPHYSHDKALPISRAYFTYSLGGQDALDFPSPWGPSKTCVRNGQGPRIRSSTADGSITIPAVYRPDKVSFPVDANGSRCAVPQELAANQRFAYYASSPRQHSPRAAGVISPVAVQKGHIGGSDAESCVGLAIPKPVYGHSPCCTERGCTAGHNFVMEHGPHRMSPHIYDEEWAARFSHLAYMHKKGQEALAQHRGLQLEHGAEAIKDRKTEGYNGIGSNRPRRSHPVMEPSYTYNTAHPFISATTDYCQRAPIPPQMYKGYPHAFDPRSLTHRGVPSKVCQDRSYMSKYTPVPPCPNIYYPQSHHEAYRTDPSAITDNHGQHHHMGQFYSPRADLMSPPCSAVPPHHPVISKYPTYPYGVHFNTNQAPMHERPQPAYPMRQSERPLDFSIRRVQTPDSPWELCRQSGTSGAFHPTSAHYKRFSNTTTLEHIDVPETGLLAGCSKEFTMNSPEKVVEVRHHISDSPDKDLLAKRSREELEMDMASKKQKIDSIHELSDDEPQSPSSPPMPVINKVFSLAPYKVYFEATGMLSSLGDSKSQKQQPEAAQLKQEPEIQNCDAEPNSSKNDLSLEQEAQMSPANSHSPVEVPESVKIKQEKLDPDDVTSQSEMKVSVAEEMNHQDSHDHVVKEEQGESDTNMSGCPPCHVEIKSDFEEESNPPLVEKCESSATCKTENAVTDDKQSFPASTLPSVPPGLPPKFSITKIPPHCLKLSSFKIVIPEVLKVPAPQPVEVPQSLVSVICSSKQARHQFMELHQSLCRLVYHRVTQTQCQELRDWLCKLDLRESGKAQKVSCLLGSKMREVWLKGDDMEVALQKVVCQLQKYIESCECPFPHVMRAGAVFIPMLVVKEVLFPQVQGTFIDQVLQEHRVELRPTTLSEERQLTQLHRKAFSSKLRRLLSLKHLPDIYPDVLNLLFHANVCKFLGTETSLTIKTESTDSSDESTGCVNGTEGFYLESSRTLTLESTCVDKLEKRYCLKTKKKKGRVKVSSKRKFLDENSSSEEDESTEEPSKWTVVSSLHRDQWEVSSVTCSDREPNVEIKIEDETQQEPENASWGRPLTSDELSSDSTDEETESTSSKSVQSHTSSLSKGPSSMVLKLRKVFYNGGKITRYQKVTDSSEAPARFSDRYRKRKHNSSRHKRHHTDREFSFSSFSQNHPYLPKTHGTNHRRWVLRSAVQSAHLPLEKRYPDLVGKRIQHLYEENDKTEVWYRGVVLRIHEPHTNPLKTVFEVKYDSEPEWQYYLELLLDYKKGWLKVED